eukprot:gene14276-15763_t
MDSQVIKDLQKLHFEDRASGLENIFHLRPPKEEEADGLSSKTPVSPRHVSLLASASLAGSVNSNDGRKEAEANAGYYYRSPCPEKKSQKDLRQHKPHGGAKNRTSSLLETAAQFCKENVVDGFASKIFVGNISYKVKNAELRDFFSLFGKVIRANVCKDRKTKRSRGFGFVIFSSREGAEAAINAKDFQLTLNGRLLNVRWAERMRKDKAKESSGLPDGQGLQDLAISFLNSKELPEREIISDQEGDSASLINKLPDDILMQIFTCLSLKERIQIERVCRRWQNLSQQTWKSLTCLNFKGMFKSFEGIGGLTDRVLNSVLKKGCSNLKCLDLSASPYLLSAHGLYVIATICTELQSLNLSAVAVSNNNLKNIGKRCKQLETLILGRCRGFGEKGLWWLLKEAGNLRHLEVTDNIRINGKCFWMLHEMCEELILADCVKLNDDGMENISKKSPNIKVLDIRNCLLVSNTGLEMVCMECKNLRRLLFTGAGLGVTFEGLMSIHLLSKLEYLDISQNQQVNDQLIQCLSASCKNLQYLNIEACRGGITDEGIKSLSDLPNLTELNISYLAEVSDASIEHLSANSSLKTIICRACPKLTNEALVTLLVFSGESLTSIDFSGCILITEKLLDDERLTQRDELQPVIKISLGGTSVTADSVAAFQSRLSRCLVSLERNDRSVLRDDFDPTTFAPFYSSDEEDEDVIEDGSHFHSWGSAEASNVVISSDTVDNSKQNVQKPALIRVDYDDYGLDDGDLNDYDDYGLNDGDLNDYGDYGLNDGDLNDYDDYGLSYDNYDDNIQDFFDADDPALMNELEDRYGW